MKNRFLAAVILLLCSCGQDYNTNSGDGTFANLGIDCTGPAGGRLCAAVRVLISNKCYSCHNSWSAYKTDQDWINSIYIVKDLPSSSLIIKKLINNGGDMPKGLGAIPADDESTLETWIQNL